MNWLAILCAGAAYWILGALWYSKLFSKPWVQAIEQHGIKLQPGGMAMKLIVTFIATSSLQSCSGDYSISWESSTFCVESKLVPRWASDFPQQL